MKTQRIGWIFIVAAVLLLVAVLSGCTIDINGPGPTRGTIYLRSDNSSIYGRVYIREPGDRYRFVDYLDPYPWGGSIRAANVRLGVTHDVRIERNGWGYIYLTIRPRFHGETIYLN